MNDNRNVTRSAKAARTIKQSAMTRAVRSVLAASALTLALGATSGTAAAATHKVPVAHALQLQRAAIDFAAVQDLSLVPQGQGLVATVTPTAIPPIIQPGDIVLNNSTAQNDSGAWPINILVISTGASGSQPGDITITNSGDLTANATSGNAFNIYANAYADLSITNSADLVTTNTGTGSAIGIVGKAKNGAITLTNDGDITATAANTIANGMYLYSGAGGSIIVNNGDITATSNNNSATGIYSASLGDQTITNSGAIDATGLGNAQGIFGLGLGDVTITNTGAIDSFGLLGVAYGLTATSLLGNATVTNDAAISTDAGGASIGINVYADGDATVTNSGAIDTYSFNTYSRGIYAYSVSATVTIDNSGAIDSYSFGGNATAIHGYSLLDEVTITNSGALSAETGGAGSALGIYASAATDATVDNSGAITVNSLGGGLVEGIFAYGLDASVTNSGDITATSNTGGMFGGGIQVYGVDSAAIDNSGDIDVSVNGIGGEAIGLYAVVNTLAGTVDVTNSGAIDVAADNAFGVDTLNGLVGAVGTVNVTNSGAITATGYYYSYGVRALGYGDVTVTNTATGSIDSTAYYQGLGILANSADGDAIVTNAGTIDATSTYLGIGAYYAIGIDAFAAAGNATVSNSGAITATSANNYAKAIWAQAAGDVAVTNSGTVLATGYYSHGVDAYSVMGNVTVGNSGGITAHSDAGRAYGIAAYAGVGDVTVTNAASGDILAESGGKYAFGIFASAPTGTTTVTNAGDITATNFPASTAPLYGDKAYGIVALGDTVVVDNSGTITADGGAKYGNGIFASSTGAGGTTVTSSGDITASSYFVSYGIDARSAGGDTTVSNGGNIAVSAYNYAYGVNAYSAVGNVVVNNSGDITATMDVLGTFAAAVKMDAPLGTSTLNNAAGGTIEAFGPDGQAWAVYGSNVIDTINNDGTIVGAINLFDGDDAFYNNATGVWDASGTYTSDFGLGNDYLRNAGDVIVSQAAIGFGDGDDTFLTVAGGEVHLSTGTIAMGAGINAFVNGGTVFANGLFNYIDAGVNGTVTNNGTIDMVDNHVNDALTVGPVLGGVGSLNIDVNQVALTADSLYVIGDMTANAVQTVNVNFPMFPITQHMTIPFAWITGNSVASNFAPGTLLNYNYPLNFIDVDLTISSAIDATNTVDDVFSINLDVNGLNDTGSIAALTAQGAANFMNAQVGTFRQRLGVNPYGDAGKVMSAYVRYYTETGDVNPGHNAHNFGQGGNFDYRQASWGTEVGVNANLWSNLHAGVVLGNADSRQRLDNPGVGTNRMDGMTFGMYLTWYVPNGWYVDLTARKMAADVYSTSVGGVLQSRVHTNAVSLEGGYEFKVGNINIVPQIQYTWTQVDEIDPYHGQYADLVLGGGHYNRGRVGVDFNTQIESGDFRWTPYGSLNWVHNSRGASEYTIGGVFHGDTWVNGSAFMAEFGVGVERGGFGFTIGGNWTDGGSYDSVLGGQASFRYSW